MFHGQACGRTENADTNAVKNILREGLTRKRILKRVHAFIEHERRCQSEPLVETENKVYGWLHKILCPWEYRKLRNFGIYAGENVKTYQK